LNTPAPVVAKEEDEPLDSTYILGEGLHPDLLQDAIITNVSASTPVKNCQNPRQRLKNVDNLYGGRASFWKCVSHPAYADINIVFKDGVLPINKSIMAAISQNIWLNLDETHDSIVIPDLAIQNFYDLIFIFAEDSIANFDDLYASCFSDDFHETVKLLGVNLFQKMKQFNHGMDRLKVKLDEVEKQLKHVQKRCGIRKSISDPSIKTLKRKKDGTNSGENIGKKGVGDEEEFSDCDDENLKKKRKVESEVVFTYADYEIDNNFVPPITHSICQPNELVHCDECEKEFQNEEILLQHLSESHGWICSSLERCVFCNCFCKNIQSVGVHEQRKCKNVANSCYKCKQELQSKNDLLGHLVKVHNVGDKRSCENCSKDFLVLVAHNSSWPHPKRCSQGKSMNKRTWKMPQECEDCGKFFKNESKHKKLCATSEKTAMKHECYECGRKFRKLVSIKRHFQTFEICKNNHENLLTFPKVFDHSKGRTTCLDCGCEYITRKGHQEHKKKCSAFTKHKCHSCGRGINTLNGFHIHFNNFPDCKDDPRNSEILLELGTKGAKAKNHVCYMCGATYKMKEWLEKHMISHAGQVEYFACKEETCAMKFITEKAVELHMASVHPDAKGECPICSQLIPRGQLKTHILNHAVKCSQCEKIFSHKGVLGAHFEAVHGPREKKKKAPRKRKPRPARPDTTGIGHLLTDVHGLVHQEVAQDLRPQAMRDPSQAIAVGSGMVQLPQLPTHHVLHAPIQAQYQPHTMIATIPAHAQQIQHIQHANQIQQFLQINAQTRYQN